ncbi:MAG: thioredoxin family protein [Candidatus Pseudobacter hemicellulosilyticus]|uniref:Thioredoxin family protein n=1 Tax=Candidatus Pseudobacter hemicellulosilyticus TaxID=3121375 RepID=A0AAJ6BH71_9BACT|nr:MAG: thioredoxin family protein [Pseudobacter sp.]
MSTLTNSKRVDPSYFTNGLTYAAYRSLIDELLKEEKVTGATQTDALVNYTRLNVQRMNRIDKTVKILSDVELVMHAVTRPQTWVVLTEGWCGDAGQILPILNTMASLNPKINLRMVLRDDNLELMDQYLTGTSRSIPRLIVADTATATELFNWGPRPSTLQDLFMQWKAEGITGTELTEKVHSWYAKDKTATTQKDIAALLKAHL